VGYIGLVVSALFLWMGCASQGNLTGGPKDVTPPRLDSLQSTTNMQTNFIPEGVVLHFDEYINLKDPNKQIIISPPLTYLPQFKIRGKTLTVRWNEKEVLKQDLTYTIQFGDAIQDFTENNILKDFKFIFATGPQIDSMVLEGKVVDAVTQKAAEGITVMLHIGMEDSTILKDKPYYFAKTDKEGKYKIENIKKASYKLSCIKDENLNFLYNEGVDAIGFDVNGVDFSNDSIRILTRDLEVSPPVIPIKLPNLAHPFPGVLKGKFNQKPNRPLQISTSLGEKASHEVFQDSIYIWYKFPQDSFLVRVEADSFRIGAPKSLKNPFAKSLKLQSGRSIRSVDTIMIAWPFPIDSFDVSSVKIRLDSTQTMGIRSRFLVPSRRRLALLLEQPSPAKYTIQVDSAAIRDVYGNVNQAFVDGFEIISPEKLATIDFSFEGLDSSKIYQVSIKEGDRVLRSFSLQGVSTHRLLLSELWPVAHSVEILEDTNGNGYWDAANYWQKVPAEKIKKFPLEKLRENWTLEAKINWLSE